MAPSDVPSALATVEDTTQPTTYVDWPAILAGAVLASAISFVLLAFGSAIGLSLTSAYEGRGISLAGFGIAAALWLIWVQVSSFMAGGYLTGRMRRRALDATERESDIRDGSHGLVVWALGVLVGAILAFSGAMTTVSAVGTATGNVAAAGVAGVAGGLDANDTAAARNILVDRFLRGGPADQPTSSDSRAEVLRILLSSLSEERLDQDDRQYLIETVAARSDLDPEQAAQRVDQLWEDAQQAEARARSAADDARKLGILVAFMTAASLLISAVGAYYGAVMGGNHRDTGTIAAWWVKPW